MNKPRLSIGLWAAAAVFLGCGVPPTEVEGVRPERRDITAYLITNGRVEASAAEPVHAQTPGTIARLHVQQGETVVAGQLLFSIADAEAPSLREQAQARLDGAKAELLRLQEGLPPAVRKEVQAGLTKLNKTRKRLTETLSQVERLVGKKALPASELTSLVAKIADLDDDIAAQEARLESPLSSQQTEAAKASVREAEAALKHVLSRLSASRILSPRSGTLYALNVVEGEAIDTTKVLARVGTLDPVTAVIYVDEPELGRVKIGSRAAIRADAYPGQEWTCSVDRLASQVVELESRRVGEARCSVASPKGRLIPNLIVAVRIVAAEAKGANSVPRAAVQTVADSDVVWVAQDGVAAAKPVRLGVRGQEFVEVLEGLDGSEMVLIPRGEGLVEGQNVQVSGGDVDD